jgi:hypothetical protein
MYGICLKSSFSEELSVEGVAKATLQYIDNESVELLNSIASHVTYCHFTTNAHLGGDFYDDPKTIATAIQCPITIDMEINSVSDFATAHESVMHKGKYCTALANQYVNISIELDGSIPAFTSTSKSRPSGFISMQPSLTRAAAIRVPH